MSISGGVAGISRICLNLLCCKDPMHGHGVAYYEKIGGPCHEVRPRAF